MDRAILTATANLLLRNQASSAWMMSGSADRRVMAANNVIAGNSGNGILVYAYQVRLFHNTIVSNTGYGVQANFTATLTMTNNIVAYNTGAGIITYTGGRISATHNLFWGNGSDPITGSNGVLGDPALLPDGYHIGPASAALNAGTPTSITSDIDGEPRLGLPDIGADEYVLGVYLPLVLRAWP
jgi:hypothetical protein